MRAGSLRTGHFTQRPGRDVWVGAHWRRLGAQRSLHQTRFKCSTTVSSSSSACPPMSPSMLNGSDIAHRVLGQAAASSRPCTGALVRSASTVLLTKAPPAQTHTVRPEPNQFLWRPIRVRVPTDARCCELASGTTCASETRLPTSFRTAGESFSPAKLISPQLFGRK
jgi:hypothetical protein